MFTKLVICLVALVAVDAGTVYTRFGRTDCPSGRELVYSGVAAGGHYTHHGGGSDLICMTLEPEYTEDTPGGTIYPSYIYGGEYETREMLDNDIPCAVCRVSARSTQIMIPGRVTCTKGSWTKEYSGKLHTGHHTHAGQKQHVCLPDDVETFPGTSANLNGALLYQVQGACGILPCPPYQADKDITCVVCTK